MRITPHIVIALLLCGIIMSATIASLAVQYARTPLPAGRVDPMRLNNSEFRQLGLIATGNQQYILRMIAKEWFFDVGQRRGGPATISIPVGSRITIVVTSMDVIHSLQVATHPVLLIRPGFIAQQTIAFDTTGTFPFICTYYCGPQHDAMRGSIIVTP
ncbi:MAG: hypothetical protein ACK5C8_07935 [Roseiflexaceae bacterium]|jgi:cytochrome c oxidase subunit II|nr:hypothetical protein [Chloroflexaceae bacterium]MCE2851194.1 hypothetical protein [Chloroflexaceae bacterium]